MRRLTLLVVLAAPPVFAATLSFPTCIGDGCFTEGGRDANAYVIYVSTLADDATKYCAPGTAGAKTGGSAPFWNPTGSPATCSTDADCTNGAGCPGSVCECIEGGAGTLRRALNSPGHRYIIPRVTGGITLTKVIGKSTDQTSGDPDSVRGDFSFYGHLAPGKDSSSPVGIVVQRYNLNMRVDTTDWIMRYMKIRKQDVAYSPFGQQVDSDHNGDAMNVGGNAEPAVMDHCEFTGGNDKVLSLGIPDLQTVTIMRSVFGFASFTAKHQSGTQVVCDTGASCIPGPKGGLTALGRGASRLTMARNAFGGSRDRNPRTGTNPTGRWYIVNNFIGLTGGKDPDQISYAIYLGNSNTNLVKVSMVENYIRPGLEYSSANSGGIYYAAFTGTSSSSLWLQNNILDAKPHTTGFCSYADTFEDAGQPCQTNADCAGASTCLANPCPSPGCGGSTAIYDLQPADPDPTYEVSDPEPGGHPYEYWTAAQTATNLVDGTPPEAGTYPPASGYRNVGANFPVEDTQLAGFLNAFKNVDISITSLCGWPCTAPASGETWCTDGTAGSGTNKKWKTDTASYVHNCTSTRHPLFTYVESFGGLCNFDGSTPCNCEGSQLNASNECNAAGACSGGGGNITCNVQNYADADAGGGDGIDDAWENGSIGGWPGCTAGNCDPNTKPCVSSDGTPWDPVRPAGDEALQSAAGNYPCIEVFAGWKVGEFSYPAAAAGATGSSMAGGGLNGSSLE